MAKLRQVLQQELAGLHPRLRLAQLLLWPLPANTGSHLRRAVLAGLGFDIGQGTRLLDMPTITGHKKLAQYLSIGRHCQLGTGCYLELGAPIRIGDGVVLEHQVLLMTTSHEIGLSVRRADLAYARPVTIADGARLGARSTILPGVTIGAGAVVAAGALVNKDVLPHTTVAGIPAKIVRETADSLPDHVA
ncbi:MAG: hypothetical protein KDE29_19535 [Anaerolineales bacterium]|nr:hypothetical protein [Anaerolineales bacterium]